MKSMRIICLSHLAWEPKLFQRPQQLMLRLAGLGHQVLYVGCVGARPLMAIPPEARIGEAQAGRLVFRNVPFSPLSRWSGLRGRLLARRIAGWSRELGDGDSPLVVWLYHPELHPVASKLPASLLVYDVMDRFAAFSRSGSRVEEYERELLKQADVVFTGGRSLHAATLALGRAADSAYCYPSGVDLDHFARALSPDTRIPKSIGKVRPPLLGYFGAIDERIDFDLLCAVAGKHPEWSIVLVGPILCSPGDLPPNIRLIGPCAYADLPSVTKAFDVAIIPFRESALVAHISPTKVPEYLAAGRPVVSTPIPDVMSDYAGVVHTVTSAAEFVKACTDILASNPNPASLVSVARERARTWDQIATEMERIVTGHLS